MKERVDVIDIDLLSKEELIKALLQEFGWLEQKQERKRLLEELKIRESGINRDDSKPYLRYFGLLRAAGHIGEDTCAAAKTKIEAIKAIDDMDKFNFQQLLDFPYNIRKPENRDLEFMRQTLDRCLYGMDEPKEMVLEEFAIRSYASNPRPRPILLVGPPGIGKTMFANAVSQALGVPKILLSLGNMFDKSLLKGFNSTWRSATSGMIFNGVLTAGCMNPVIIMDEVDKAAGGKETGRIIDICCDLLEPESAARFVDDYYEIPFDLSAAMFFLTANEIAMVPDYVVDRCMVVPIRDYTSEERAYIIKHYICRQIIEEQALKIDIEISDDFALGLATATRSLRAARKTILRHVGQHLLNIGGGIVVEQIVLKRVDPRLVVMASAAKRPARF